jgi:hypothetical protein
VALYGIKAGVSVLDEATLNAFIIPHATSLIYDGSKFDYAGVPVTTEYPLSDRSVAIRFTTDATGTIGRLWIELRKYGVGADLTIEIRDNTYNQNGTNDGVLIKTIKWPKELIYSGGQNILIDVSGLAANTFYWLVFKQAGDATNHIRLCGVTSQDANHPCYYRNGSTGAWTPHNCVMFELNNQTFGTGMLVGVVYGQYAKSVMSYWPDSRIDWVRSCVQAPDGSFPAIRIIQATYDSGNNLMSMKEV